MIFERIGSVFGGFEIVSANYYLLVLKSAETMVDSSSFECWYVSVFCFVCSVSKHNWEFDHHVTELSIF